MDKPVQLTRICSSCGIQKPLSAFLQLGGDHGASYGAICADCRRSSMGAKKPKTTKDSSDGTTTATGLRIDTKSKFTADMENRRKLQAIKQQAKEEAKKHELLNIEKETLKERKEKTENEYRKSYLETNKAGFISESNKKPAVNKQTGVTKQSINNQKVATSPQEKKLENIEDIIEQELQLTTIDLTNQFVDPQFAEIRHQSSLFAQFKQWLGAASPLGKANAIKEMQHLQKTQAEKNLSDKKLFNKKVEKKDSLTEYVDKTWSPSAKSKK